MYQNYMNNKIFIFINKYYESQRRFKIIDVQNINNGKYTVKIQK